MTFSVPLTEHLKDAESIVEQAAEFLSAFSEHRRGYYEPPLNS